jgi:HEAT repeat protein
MVKQSPDESRLLAEVIRALSCDDPTVRRKALDAVVISAMKPGWDPAEFISHGGIPALVGRLREEDEKSRVKAVKAVEKLAVPGAVAGLVEAGALPILEQMAAGDPYGQLRMMAGRALAKIRGMMKD